MASATRIYKTGQYLFKEGEPSNCIFIVKRGCISIRKVKGFAFVEIARIYQKEVIGELSFFDRLPRSAAAVAINEVEVTVIMFDDLDKIYNSIPDYLKSIMAAMADRMRKANETIRKLQKASVADPGQDARDGQYVPGQAPTPAGAAITAAATAAHGAPAPAAAAPSKYINPYAAGYDPKAAMQVIDPAYAATMGSSPAPAPAPAAAAAPPAAPQPATAPATAPAPAAAPATPPQTGTK